MTMEQFKAMVRGFCEDAGIDDDGTPLLITVDDTPVKIGWLGDLDACRLQIDLGERPAANSRPGRPAFAEFLLALNLDDDRSDHGVFSLHPGSGHVILTLHIPMSAFDTGRRLLDVVMAQVPAALDAWSCALDDHLLCDSGPPRAADPITANQCV